jgi:hypothetical protein
MSATDIDDAALARLDLAVLTVQGIVETPARLLLPSGRPGLVRCHGFIGFFQHQFERSQVTGKVERIVETIMPDGTVIDYMEIKAGRNSARFKKGLSGGPVFGRGDNVIGVARILDGPAEGSTRGYAIQFSPTVISLVQEKVPSDISGAPSDRPQAPPPPRSDSIKIDDIQKNRWGGSSEGYGRRLTIENLQEYRRYFTFDAVIEATDKKPLKGPFVFHLHDTFAKSVVWIRKTNGSRAVLEGIDAIGTFTFGVQLKNGEGRWVSLEFDLGEYENRRLAKKYD